jgi:hypothetical protein
MGTLLFCAQIPVLIHGQANRLQGLPNLFKRSFTAKILTATSGKTLFLSICIPSCSIANQYSGKVNNIPRVNWGSKNRRGLPHELVFGSIASDNQKCTYFNQANHTI